MSAVIGRKLWKGWHGKWACKGVTRNVVVSLIHSPTSLYSYKCSLFIGLNYRLCGVYNSAPQLLQCILGIFLYLLFVSGVILPRRHQILGLRDQPAQRTSGFVDGPLALRRRSPPCLAPGFGDEPLGPRLRSPPQVRRKPPTSDARFSRAPARASAHMSGGRTGVPAPSMSAFLCLPAHTY